VPGERKAFLPVISAVTLAELEYGVVCSGVGRHQNRQALDALPEDIPDAQFDGAAARAYNPIRLRYSVWSSERLSPG
jgi:predicted nucleic acid-binding protein